MIPGRYIPQCSANGDYQAVQNHASTGHYWCVDVKTGEEVDGTRQRFVKPECDGREFFLNRYQCILCQDAFKILSSFYNTIESFKTDIVQDRLKS